MRVFAPDRLRGSDVVDRLAAVAPSLFVVAAYGKILRPDILALPDRGTLNVHASLLPKYRGAAPIAGALYQGEPAGGRKHREGAEQGGHGGHAVDRACVMHIIASYGMANVSLCRWERELR